LFLFFEAKFPPHEKNSLNKEAGIEKFLFAFFDKRGKKLVKSPPPLKDALTFLAETIVHVAVELTIGFFKELNL